MIGSLVAGFLLRRYMPPLLPGFDIGTIHQITIDAQGLHRYVSQGRRHFDWDQSGNVLETRTMFIVTEQKPLWRLGQLLRVDQRFIRFVLPKRAFADEAQQQQFREWARAHVSLEQR